MPVQWRGGILLMSLQDTYLEGPLPERCDACAHGAHMSLTILRLGPRREDLEGPGVLVVFHGKTVVPKVHRGLIDVNHRATQLLLDDLVDLELFNCFLSWWCNFGCRGHISYLDIICQLLDFRHVNLRNDNFFDLGWCLIRSGSRLYAVPPLKVGPVSGICHYHSYGYPRYGPEDPARVGAPRTLEVYHLARQWLRVELPEGLLAVIAID